VNMRMSVSTRATIGRSEWHNLLVQLRQAA